MRISDWSSDVCSSDLSPHLRLAPPGGERDGHDQPRRVPAAFDRAAEIITHAAFHQQGAETGTLRLGNRAFPAAFGPDQAELAIVHILAVLGPVYFDAARIERQRAMLDRVGREFVEQQRHRSEEHTSEIQSLM